MADIKPPCVVCAYPASSRCAGCQKVNYCSKAHQKHAWPTHKRLCKIYSSPTPPSPDTYCGLCGNTSNLTKTPCCNRSICKDDAAYRPGSFSSVSCSRNHARYTLCGFHHGERHGGKWQDCSKCAEKISSKEVLIGQGTSSFNFLEDKWDNVPTFEPSHCAGCKKQIKMATDTHSPMPDGVQCTTCMMKMVGSEGLGGIGMMDGTGISGVNFR